MEKTVYPGLDTTLVPPLSGDVTELVVPIPITVSPATPDGEEVEMLLVNSTSEGEKEKEKEKSKKEKKQASDVLPKSKRSSSLERGDTTKTKKVQKIFKDQVHKGRAGITAVSRKIGRNGVRRSNSTPSTFVFPFFCT